jgi:hypothetical protein
MGVAHPQGAERRQGPGDVTYKWSENVANNDYERIMRQYRRGGERSRHRRDFRGRARGAAGRANYPKWRS